MWGAPAHCRTAQRLLGAVVLAQIARGAVPFEVWWELGVCRFCGARLVTKGLRKRFADSALQCAEGVLPPHFYFPFNSDSPDDTDKNVRENQLRSKPPKALYAPQGCRQPWRTPIVDQGLSEKLRRFATDISSLSSSSSIG